jgi:hypothetical protein
MIFSQKKSFYGGFAMGSFFIGDITVGDKRSGADGINVRNIDFNNDGSIAGFTIEGSLGYQINKTISAEIALGIGFSGSSVNTGYSESKVFYSGFGFGPAETFTDNDKLRWGGGFTSIDGSVNYNILGSAKSNTPFFINGKLGVGFFNYFRGDLLRTDVNFNKAGGLRYSKITGWHEGKDPGADYSETYLVKLAEGFYIKPGIDFGVTLKRTRIQLNTYVKLFPASFADNQKPVINDGINNRTIGLSLPSWAIPGITLGIIHLFQG